MLELCRVLLSSLAKFGVPIERGLFTGSMRSTLRCQVCGHASERREAFSDVALDVAGVSSVLAALDAYVAPERLDGERLSRASSC